MTAEERLRLINAKTERAHEHFGNLEAEITAFGDSKPYEVRTERDPETRRLIYYLSKVQSVPLRIPLIAGDTLQNLRSALDHLVRQMVLAAGNDPHDNLSFPIYDDTCPSKGVRGQVTGISAEAQQAVDALKPYKTGNPPLWVLHRLNNIDKHRMILTPFSNYHSVDIGPDLMQTMTDDTRFSGFDFHLFLRPASYLDPIKAGDKLYVSLPDAEEQQNMQFRFDISISEPGVIEGESLLTTLSDLGKMVQETVTGLSRFL